MPPPYTLSPKANARTRPVLNRVPPQPNRVLTPPSTTRLMPIEQSRRKLTSVLPVRQLLRPSLETDLVDLVKLGEPAHRG